MKRIAGIWVLAALVHGHFADGAEGKKKLIEFGWDEPGTAFLKAHAAELEKSPFDGTVFHVDYRNEKSKGSFTWQGWGTVAFKESDLKEAVEELKSASFRRMRFNFLRFNTAPAKLDWFDDYSAVLTNAWLAARVAKLGNCPGLLFDTEQYEGQLFDYRQQRDRATKSWEVYAAQTRQRGRETMEQFQRAYPGLTVFLTFGYSLPWVETGRGKTALAECHYGLLAPFMDGMLEAAQGKTTIVDGYEVSYGYVKKEQYEDAYSLMKSGVLPIVARPEIYQKHSSFGFGIWLDYQWRKLGWDADVPAKNYFNPEKFEQSVSAALERSDKYVWIYTETPRWWSEPGGPVKLPAVYDEILRRAMSGGGEKRLRKGH